MKLFSRIFLLLAVSALALASCKKDDVIVDDDKDTEETPQRRPNEYDSGKGVKLLGATSFLNISPEVFDPQNSMTITMVVEGLETTVKEQDRLIAFLGNKCCGVAVPDFDANSTNPYFFLLVSLDEEDLSGGTVTIDLCYYSTLSKKKYTTLNPIIYETNAIIGSYAHPYAPEWK